MKLVAIYNVALIIIQSVKVFKYEYLSASSSHSTAKLLVPDAAV